MSLVSPMPFGGVVVVTTRRGPQRAANRSVSNAFRRGGRGDFISRHAPTQEQIESPMPFGGVVVVTR